MSNSSNFDDKLNKIDEKIDRIQFKIASIDSTLAAQHESLKIHIKRTNLLEKKLEPVEKHVWAIHTFFKFIGYLAAIVAIIEGLSKVFHV